MSDSIWSIDGCLRKFRRSWPSHSKFSGSSWRLKYCSLMCWKAPHLAIICQGVSSSSLQCLQSGSGLLMGSSKWLWRFKKQWPVSHLIAFPKLVLVHCIICFVIFGFGFWKNSFVCLQVLLLIHLCVQWKLMRFLIVILKKVVGRGSQGSGPEVMVQAPNLACSSAISFPEIPQWAFTHLRVISLLMEACSRVFWHDSVVLE